MKKVCNICKEEKLLEEFGKETRRPDGLQLKCKLCKRQYDNNFYKERPDSKKKDKIQQDKKRCNEVKIYIYNFLLKRGCSSCEESRVATLDFHHLKDKKFNISNSLGRSLESVKKEIEKCEVLCSNCHRVRTAEELGWYKYIN